MTIPPVVLSTETRTYFLHNSLRACFTAKFLESLLMLLYVLLLFVTHSPYSLILYECFPSSRSIFLQVKLFVYAMLKHNHFCLLNFFSQLLETGGVFLSDFRSFSIWFFYYFKQHLSFPLKYGHHFLYERKVSVTAWFNIWILKEIYKFSKLSYKIQWYRFNMLVNYGWSNKFADFVRGSASAFSLWRIGTPWTSE